MELESIKGIGPKTIKLLNKININNIDDLVSYYPFRYNYIKIESINDIIDDNSHYIRCTIGSYPKVSYIKNNLNRLTFEGISENRNIHIIIFNRAFMRYNIHIGNEIILYGKFNPLTSHFMASDVKFESVEKDERIESVYHLVSGISSKKLNTMISTVLNNTEINYHDFIPEYLNEKYSFIDKASALKYIHEPNSLEDIKKGNLKLIYEELFKFTFKINYLKIRRKKEQNISNKKVYETELNEFIASLPFTLTSDQLTALEDIKNDYHNQIRMNRLLLGDVGSGKTIVAFIAMYLNFLNNYQSALMAPTELLAKQHYNEMKKYFEPLGVRFAFLSGSVSKEEKYNIKDALKQGRLDMVVGTHAIITDNVYFKNLGLVITDEQHRFGVNQRNTLQNKGNSPDILYLSATPIPRTYALSLYGDMDISMIKSKPKGRKEIETLLFKNKDIKKVLEIIYSEIKQNHQVYIVAPLINESEYNTYLEDVNKLKKKFDDAFQNKFKTEIMHGRLEQAKKDKIMKDFKDKKFPILISTTVIEVGIDVKEATLIVIYNAEMYGLATLHQLRGRVGRSDLQSKCILISEKDTERLEILTQTNDGFKISEKDFEIRKGGDLFGIRQSGDMCFHIADIKRDYRILEQTNIDSEHFIKTNLNNNFNNYPLFETVIDEISIAD